MNIGKATRKGTNILRRRLLKIEAEIKKTVIMAGHKRSPLAEANADPTKIDEFLSDVFAESHRPHENPAKSNR